MEEGINESERGRERECVTVFSDVANFRLSFATPKTMKCVVMSLGQAQISAQVLKLLACLPGVMVRILGTNHSVFAVLLRYIRENWKSHLFLSTLFTI